MNKLHAAVAGLGFMGGAHIEALRRIDIDVIGCLGTTPEGSQAGAQQYGLSRGYSSFDELAADPDVDVVHICTPNYLHYAMCKGAILAGKHVICEKPLAVSSAQSAQLTRLAAERGIVDAVNYNMRFYPLCQEGHDRIQAGEIGEVRIIHGHYLQDWLFFPTDWNWRLEPEQGGALRAVADIGTHWLDMVIWLSGLRITAVMADLATLIPTRYKPAGSVETFANKLGVDSEAQEVPIATEDYATIMLRFSNGARGVVTLSQVSAGHKNQFEWEVNGSVASLRWAQEEPNHLWLGHRDQPNGVLIKDPSLMHESARSTASYPGGHAEGYPDTFKQLFRKVYGYIEAEDFSAPRPFPTFADGHQEMLLCDAILQSSQQGQWVEVPAV